MYRDIFKLSAYLFLYTDIYIDYMLDVYRSINRQSYYLQKILFDKFLYLLNMITIHSMMVSRFGQLNYGLGLARALKCIMHWKIRAAAFFR